MILDRLNTIFAAFGPPENRQAMRAARTMSKRWQRAFRDQPELAEDIIRLSGLLRSSPVLMTQGQPELAPLDASVLAQEAGRQDMARLLLSLGHFTTFELNQLVEKTDDI